MIPALLFIAWTVISVVVGSVIGLAIRAADEQEAKRRAHEAEVRRVIRNKARGAA